MDICLTTRRMSMPYRRPWNMNWQTGALHRHSDRLRKREREETRWAEPWSTWESWRICLWERAKRGK